METLLCQMCREPHPADKQKFVDAIRKHFPSYKRLSCDQCKHTEQTVDAMVEHYSREHPDSDIIIRQAKDKIFEDVTERIYADSITAANKEPQVGERKTAEKREEDKPAEVKNVKSVKHRASGRDGSQAVATPPKVDGAKADQVRKEDNSGKKTAEKREVKPAEVKVVKSVKYRTGGWGDSPAVATPPKVDGGKADQVRKEDNSGKKTTEKREEVKPAEAKVVESVKYRTGGWNVPPAVATPPKIDGGAAFKIDQVRKEDSGKKTTEKREEVKPAEVNSAKSEQFHSGQWYSSSALAISPKVGGRDALKADQMRKEGNSGKETSKFAEKPAPKFTPVNTRIYKTGGW